MGNGASLNFRFETGRYYFKKNFDFNQETWQKKISGFAITPEYRNYWETRSRLNRPVGPFWGIYGKYFSGWYEQDFNDPVEYDVKQTFFAAGLGGVLGYKYKHPDKMWFFETLGGLGWGYSGLKKFEYESFPNQALLWRIELSIGYSFW